MARKTRLTPDDEANDSPKVKPHGDRRRDERTGEAQAAENREVDPPA